MKVSILIPAYNEEGKIAQTIGAVQNLLKTLPYFWEIIVICDGKEDNTFKVASGYRNSQIKILGYPQNRGKGYALKHGFAHTQGDLIIFFDAGLEFDPIHIREILEYYQKHKTPVIIGSKRHPDSQVIYPLRRRFLSRSAQTLIKLLFQMNVKDSQVGLKLFERRVLLRIFPKVLVKAYAFDIELLALAHHYRYRIMEIPVNLKMDFGHSSIKLSSINKSLRDTLAVFYRLKILKFYDKPKKIRDGMIRKYQTK